MGDASELPDLSDDDVAVVKRLWSELEEFRRMIVVRCIEPDTDGNASPEFRLETDHELRQRIVASLSAKT